MLGIKETHQVQRSVINLVSVCRRLDLCAHGGIVVGLLSHLLAECGAKEEHLGSEPTSVIGHNYIQISAHCVPVHILKSIKYLANEFINIAGEITAYGIYFH